MPVRYVTFGPAHERESDLSWVRAEGYVIFEAPTDALVWKLIEAVLGTHYAFAYLNRPDGNERGKRWYPEGSTAHITMNFSTAYESGWNGGR